MRSRIEFKRGQKAGVLITHVIKLEAGIFLLMGNSFSFASKFKKNYWASFYNHVSPITVFGRP